MTIRQRRKKLEEMERGNGLSDAYTATLSRLKAQNGNRVGLGLRALMWVSYSEKPLRAEQLCHALGVEIGSTDLDPDNVPALRTLLSSCLGLLTVEASSSIVRLVHFTLQEHLLSDPTIFHSPHSTVAEVCLTYLNSRSVRDLSPTLRSAPSTMPFLKYASLHWAAHTKRGMTENVRILALRLLDRFDEHISAQLLLLKHEKWGFFGPKVRGVEGRVGFTGLHGGAYLGMVDVVATIMEMKNSDANASDFTGSTALTWAAYKGHREVVKILLEREDVNPNHAVAEYGWTPLELAAAGGHEGVAKMLLERNDVNPDRPNKYGGTPLLLAAANGHEGIVKILLERNDVNPDRPNKYGQTPLLLAAAGGHEGVAKMLLERNDVNPDQADTKYGQTPLMLAADGGHEGIVKILLERNDVNPNLVDTEYGQTPLFLAAEGGHEGIVKILLERNDVNPNLADTKYCQTPLSWAAEGGHEGVAKMLLERNDVKPDQPDTEYGRTPLSMAAANGHEGIVKMLLERNDVSPDQPDTEYGRTPLSWAAEGGPEGVVKVFLELNDFRTTIPHDENLAPQPVAPPLPHNRPIDIPLKPDHLNSPVSGTSSQASLPPPAEPTEEGLVETKFSSSCPNANIKDSNINPPLPPLDSIELELVPELMHPLSASPDAPSTTKPSVLLQLASLRPLMFLPSLRKSDTRPNNTRSPLPIVLNRYWTIYSCLCLLVSVAYRKNSRNRTSRQGVGAALARKVLHIFLFAVLKLGLGNRRWRELLRSRHK